MQILCQEILKILHTPNDYCGVTACTSRKALPLCAVRVHDISKHGNSLFLMETSCIIGKSGPIPSGYLGSIPYQSPVLPFAPGWRVGYNYYLEKCPEQL